MKTPLVTSRSHLLEFETLLKRKQLTATVTLITASRAGVRRVGRGVSSCGDGTNGLNPAPMPLPTHADWPSGFPIIG